MSLAARALSVFQPAANARQVGPIGIDFALESVHLVQLEKTSTGALQVRARASVPFEGPRRELLERPHQFRSLIRRALGEAKFQGRKAVLAMPSGMFRTVSINYRYGGSEAQEGAAVLKVMKDRLDGDLANYVLDYMPVSNRSKKDERLAIVAVSERKPVIEFLELVRKSGLDAEALEIGPVAISRLFGTLSAEQGKRNILVINSGRRASYLTLISGSDLLFDQEVGFGEESLIHQVAETLDMSPKLARDLVLRTGVHSVPGEASEANDDIGLMTTMSEILKPKFLKLVAEIKRAFLYAASETRGGGVSQVYLLGGIARWKGSDHLLSELAEVDVRKIPDPLALFPNDEHQSAAETAAPEVAVATGLALRGLQHG